MNVKSACNPNKKWKNKTCQCAKEIIVGIRMDLKNLNGIADDSKVVIDETILYQQKRQIL